jgi:hypothetical protein
MHAGPGIAINGEDSHDDPCCSVKIERMFSWIGEARPMIEYQLPSWLHEAMERAGSARTTRNFTQDSDSESRSQTIKFSRQVALKLLQAPVFFQASLAYTPRGKMAKMPKMSINRSLIMLKAFYFW